MIKKEELRILLLQIRDLEITRKEEFDLYVKYTGLEPGQIDYINLPYDKIPEKIEDNYDAVIIGGSSKGNVSDSKFYSQFRQELEDLIRRCIDKNIPTLAICFGFHAAVSALGGRVARDKQLAETGVVPIILSSRAQSDPLFYEISDDFPALSYHNDSCVDLPPNVIKLARTEKCFNHAFRVKEKNFYALQFHPEIDREGFITRIRRYYEDYLEDKHALDVAIRDAKETPEANKLISNFIENIVMTSA